MVEIERERRKKVEKRWKNKTENLKRKSFKLPFPQMASECVEGREGRGIKKVEGKEENNWERERRRKAIFSEAPKGDGWFFWEKI